MRFLVGSPIDFEQVLSYLPYGVELHSDEERTANKIKRQNEAPNQKRFVSIETQKYLLGEVKYDLSIYTSIDIASIDYILITKLDNIYALPILTEGFRFEGNIIMTQPIHQLGYQILKEFASINEQRKQKGNQVNTDMMEEIEDYPFVKNIWEDSEVIDQFEKEGKYITEWSSCFKQEDLDACWEKVKVVNYKEELTLRGGIKVTPTASGYHLGSACYSIGFGQDRLLVMDSYSLHRYRHCLPFDYRALKDHNRILLTDTFFSSDEVKPQNENESRLNQAELCVNRFVGLLKKTLKDHKNENILLPIRNLFFLLDIIDIIKEKVSGFVKIHIITSTIEPMIKYANANVDYLNKALQMKIYQQKPDLPFSFDLLAEKNRIVYYNDIHEFVDKIKFQPRYMTDTTPSLYFVVDSSFRLGYSGKIFDILNNELKAGTVIFTDPHLCYNKLFEPLYHNLKIRIVNFPLNLNDSLVSTVNLIKKDTQESKIIVPEKYFKILRGSPIGDRLVMLKENSSIEFEVVGKDSIYCKPQAYNSLKPKTLESILPLKLEKSDIMVDSIQGNLSTASGKTTLSVTEWRKEETPAILVLDRNSKHSDQQIYEKMQELARKLKEQGLPLVGVEKRADEASTFVLKAGESIIKHNASQTDIFTDNEQEYKIILKTIKLVLGVHALA